MPPFSPPHARTDPPWCDCGDRSSPDFGAVFLDIDADGTVFIFFDRALTQAYGWTRTLPTTETVLFGRRFAVSVVRDGRPPARRSRQLDPAEPM